MDTDVHAAGVTSATRAAVAYDWIKRELLSGAFPISVRLGEERLAGELDVSRTPVREALSRLHAEGLVDHHVDGGYVPAIPDLTVIVELYEVRASLELTALGRVEVTHDIPALEVLRAEWQSLAVDEGAQRADPGFVLVDEDFHLRLARAAGNQSLVGVLGGVNERIRIVRMHDFLSSTRIAATITQHLAILDAVIGGDLSRASATLVAHLDESAAFVYDRAARAIANMVSTSAVAR